VLLNPLPIKIEHRIGVQAPGSLIWEILSDIPGWPAWNPLYPKAEGVLRIDAVLTLDLALPGQAPRTIQPVVVDWVPSEQILWRTASHGGLVRATRYLEIESLNDASCIFSNGEVLEGPMIRFISRRARRTMKAGFTAVGEVLRDRAEALWREREGKATLGGS